MTRRHGCGVPPASGVTIDRPSYTCEPESQRSVDAVPGSAAVYAVPPMVNTTEAVGRVRAKEADEAAAGVIGNVPAEGALTVTIANRIDPSGHVFLTSVWVGKPAT